MATPLAVAQSYAGQYCSIEIKQHGDDNPNPASSAKDCAMYCGSAHFERSCIKNNACLCYQSWGFWIGTKNCYYTPHLCNANLPMANVTKDILIKPEREIHVMGTQDGTVWEDGVVRVGKDTGPTIDNVEYLAIKNTAPTPKTDTRPFDAVV